MSNSLISRANIPNVDAEQLFSNEGEFQEIDHALGTVTLSEQIFRYFGINRRVRQTIKNKKGETKTKQVVKAYLVLENGDLVDVDSLNDVYLRTQLNISEKRLSNKAIMDFQIKKNVFTYAQAFNMLRDNYKKYMVFEREEWYELNAIWDLATYHYDLIDKFLIIKHEGGSGTAKSKGMNVSKHHSFNGRKWLCPNPANFFRYRHFSKAVICIEEAEKLFGDGKKNQGDSELVEYLNGSYEKGNFVPRQSDNDRNLTEEFDPAGFLRIGSIKPLMGALEKRSITLPMIKAPKHDHRANIEVPSSDRSPDFNSFQKARDACYISSLTHYKEFLKMMNKMQRHKKLNNREFSLAKPLLSLAKCIDEKLYERLSEFLCELFDARDASAVNEDSWSHKLMIALLKLTKVPSNGDFYSNEVIKTEFEKELNDQYKSITTRTITKLMQEITLSQFYRRNHSGDKWGYFLTNEQLAQQFVRNCQMDVQEIKKYVSDLSELSEINQKREEIASLQSDKSSDKTSDKRDFSLKVDAGDSISDKLTVLTKNTGTLKLPPKFYQKNILLYIKQKGLVKIEDVWKFSKNNYELSEVNFNKYVDKLKTQGDVSEVKSGYLQVI